MLSKLILKLSVTEKLKMQNYVKVTVGSSVASLAVLFFCCTLNKSLLNSLFTFFICFWGVEVVLWFGD